MYLQQLLCTIVCSGMTSHARRNRVIKFANAKPVRRLVVVTEGNACDAIRSPAHPYHSPDFP